MLLMTFAVCLTTLPPALILAGSSGQNEILPGSSTYKDYAPVQTAYTTPLKCFSSQWDRKYLSALA